MTRPIHPAWHVLLWGPGRIRSRLDALEARGVIERAPSLWQVWLGVLYMWTRVLTRPDTIGVPDGTPARTTRRARLLDNRLARLPVLLATRSVNPLDQIGLGSSTEHVIRHLLGAWHPGDNALYDLQLLDVEPGALLDLRARLAAIVDGSHPRADLLRDLVVYEGYHARLLDVVDRWLAEGPAALPSDHPDTTLPAFLRWCAQQPDGPAATLEALRRGGLSLTPRLGP